MSEEPHRNTKIQENSSLLMLIDVHSKYRSSIAQFNSNIGLQ